MLSTEQQLTITIDKTIKLNCVYNAVKKKGDQKLSHLSFILKGLFSFWLSAARHLLLQRAQCFEIT